MDLQPHEVTDDLVDLFIEQFPRFNGYFKISCKTDQGIEEMLSEITRVLSSSSFSFKETFDTFTLHGQHTAGQCCPDEDPRHEHEPSSRYVPGGNSVGGGGSCCAK